MFENEGDKQNKQGHHDIGESDAYQIRLTCRPKEACLDGWQDVSEITSGRSFCYVVTRLLLRRDVGNATSGRNFCSIVGGFSIKSIENHSKLNRK